MLFFLFFLETEAQIIFEKTPKDFAIIPRNPATNMGSFEVSGIVPDNKYTTIEIRAYQKGKLKGNSIKTLYFTGSYSTFNFQLNLAAGLFNYDFKFYLNDGTTSKLVTEVKSVAFGDVILITGQSNAVANSYNGTVNSKYGDSFIRSFGTASSNGSAVFSNLNWYIANGDGYYDKGTVGQWGLVMARQIMDSVKVPIAIINNAVGGTPITFHQKNQSNPTDLNTSYGRQLFRATEAQVNKKARFMFYYQGESDGSAAKLHDSLFKIMHRDWRTDFIGLEKIYVVQVRSGCGSPSLQLREVQRQFEFVLPRTRTLTMTGFSGHDGCHFALAKGYESLGFEAANCMLDEFYGKKNKKDIYPLNPVYAYFSKADYTEITLELNQHIQTLKGDVNFYQLFQLEGNSGVIITGGSIVKNKIVLNLSARACSIKGLSYNGAAGAPPWVTNSNGIGLLSFYNLPVYAAKRVGGIVNLCSGSNFTPKIDTITGYTYLWKGNSSKLSSTKAWPVIKPKLSETFELTIQDKSKVCKADTQFYYLNIDSVKNPNLPSFIHLCPGDSFKTGLNYTSNSFVWKRNNIELSKSQNIIIKEKGTYSVDIYSGYNCRIGDTILVTQSLAVNILDSVYYKCPESMLNLKAPKNFVSYCWNNDTTMITDSFLVKGGLVKIRTKDSTACIYKDSAIIKNYITENYFLDTVPVFCDYSYHLYFKPARIVTWYLNSNEILNNYYYFTQKDSGYFKLFDSNNCSQDIAIAPKVIKKPIQQNYSYPVCDGQSTTVQLNPAYNYQWIDGYFGSKKTITHSGIYKYKVINTFCEYEDSILFWKPEKPKWNIPTDTVICKESNIHFDLPKTIISAFVNGIKFIDTVELKEEGYYQISGFDSLNCSYDWSIRVTEKNCLNTSNIERLKSYTLYPNPATHQIVLIGETVFSQFKLMLFDFSGRQLPLKYEVISLNEIHIDISTLSAGIYLLKLENKGTYSNFRVVKK